MSKLAAIMFTDIVGYSAMMSKNEGLAMDSLKKNRDIILPALQQFNGSFIKEIGDGTLSLFQSSWDAVNCAIHIQRLVHELSLQLRIDSMWEMSLFRIPMSSVTGSTLPPASRWLASPAAFISPIRYMMISGTKRRLPLNT
jgi:hypothetical protein